MFQTVSVALDDLVSTLIPLIHRNASIPQTSEILLFEEVKPGMIEPVSLDVTFGSAELLDGDILCFQPLLTREQEQTLGDPLMALAPAYYEMVMNRIEVLFKLKSSHLDENGQEFRLVLNKKMNYEQVRISGLISIYFIEIFTLNL